MRRQTIRCEFAAVADAFMLGAVNAPAEVKSDTASSKNSLSLVVDINVVLLRRIAS